MSNLEEPGQENPQDEGDEASDGEPSDESEQGPVASAGPDIFVSYRLDPDQPTAIALKRLLEGSLEPTPRVFVSGAGGLRPSNIGLRPQLQAAVRSARAFVALITPQSKEREWVIFEAGAAWGRDQFYAPVLLETEPHELGTTIADSVATKADSRDQMELLANELAKQLGCSVRSHFGSRYSAFERHLERVSEKARAKQQTSPRENDNDFMRAMALWNRGERDEARDVLTLAEERASNSEDKARARISRLWLEREETGGFHEAVLALDGELKESAEWKAWAGIIERSPHIAVDWYEQALRTPSITDNNRQNVIEYKANSLFLSGRDEEAVASIVQGFGEVEPARRLSRTFILWDKYSGLQPISKLLLAASTISGDHSDLFRRLTDLAIDQSWPAIAVWAARNYARKSDTSSAKNSLGRAYHSVKLFSLAHDAYRAATVAGASVSKVNLALCVAHNPVPGAALAMLKEHAGDFDSLDPQFPHRVRADIEQLVHQEGERGGEMYQRGARTMFMLAELVDFALSQSGEANLSAPSFDLRTSDGYLAKLSPVTPFGNIFEGSVAKEKYGFFAKVTDPPLQVRGVLLDLREDKESLRTQLDHQLETPAASG